MKTPMTHTALQEEIAYAKDRAFNFAKSIDEYEAAGDYDGVDHWTARWVEAQEVVDRLEAKLEEVSR